MDGASRPRATESRSRRVRRWILRSTLAVVALVVLLAIARGVFDLWRHAVVPADAPRIAMSLEDTWLNELGIVRATYDQVMARAGAHLVTVEPDATAAFGPERARDLLAGIDGLLLTGGGDVDPTLYGGDPVRAQSVDRPRDDFELALLREARRRGLPILGICRGCQILNVSQGGTLRDMRDDAELAATHFGLAGHDVEITAQSHIGRALGVTRLRAVPSFHGQAVDRPGESVRVTARSPDGVIEAIEIAPETGAWIVGIQWHPELTILDEKQLAIIEAFVAAARGARARRLEDA